MIPTEPIGSIPRPRALREAFTAFTEHRCSQSALDRAYDAALRETIAEFEATGSPVITDGEQAKPSFATYPLHGLQNLSADGVTITFADGHQRRLPRLSAGPFRYSTYADRYLKAAQRYTRIPIKQAVISASALSLLYPEEGIPGYPRETFLGDLLDEAETDIRRCLDAGAHSVQIDFTEGRLSIKLDPSGQLLKSFIDLNNRVLSRFSPDQRARIGIHTCPGGDHDSTHSAEVDYGALLPHLFTLHVGRFYIQLASERERVHVLELIKAYAQPHHTIFVGVIDPLIPQIETAGEVRDRVLEAAAVIPVPRLGTTDDCGFAPFGDDTSTTREIAFAKIRARLAGTTLAARQLGA
jgi:5-methyltetrahydropteroyltriglutamate--homocysteine methyltransferase